jgi:hypothetical protein
VRVLILFSAHRCNIGLNTASFETNNDHGGDQITQTGIDGDCCRSGSRDKNDKADGVYDTSEADGSELAEILVLRC